MLCAYRDRITADRKREQMNLRFLASALGATFRDEPLDDPPPMRRTEKRSAADVIRSMGGVVTTVKH